MLRLLTLVAPAALLLALAPPSDKELIAQQLPSYPLTTCVVSGETLGQMSAAVDYVHDGRLVRFCCKKCVAEFEKSPERYLDKIDVAVEAAQKADYPLTTCMVSGEDLGEEPVTVVHGTRLVQFCCKKCVKEFDKDPARWMKELDGAYVAAQKADYPLTTCVVSGEDLGDDAVDFVYGTKLVRFCCKKCVAEFEKSPTRYLAKLSGHAGEKPAGYGSSRG